jgi:aminoglycoside phosphotransferase (APT) family kinase protein
MVGEAQLLRAAMAAGVPVAEVVAADDDGEPLGAPYLVMRRIEGETIARRILRSDDLTDARRGLTAECGTALAAIHGIDPSSVPALAPVDPLAQARDLIDGFADVAGPHPAFELAVRWLEANRRPAGPPTVVHGDFRNGNLVVGADGLRAVLDWELAHVGDALEDLGWLCVRAWRFGAAAPVGGFGDRRQLYEAYGAARGIDVDPAAVHWWEVMGTLRWGTICIVQTAGHLYGHARSVELAAIGRRVCETEHDLLTLLP